MIEVDKIRIHLPCYNSAVGRYRASTFNSALLQQHGYDAEETLGTVILIIREIFSPEYIPHFINGMVAILKKTTGHLYVNLEQPENLQELTEHQLNTEQGADAYLFEVSRLARQHLDVVELTYFVFHLICEISFLASVIDEMAISAQMGGKLDE